MRYLVCLTLLVARCAVGGFDDRTDRRNLADVPFLQNIDVEPTGIYGLPLSQKNTIIFFHELQRELYRNALLGPEDRPFPDETWKRAIGSVALQLVSVRGRDMTWAEALYAIQTVLRKMLYPSLSGQFREQTWLVFRKQGTTRLGNIANVIVEYKMPGMISGLSPINTSSSYTPDQPPDTISLTAPFPVPGSDLTLLIGSRGRDLPFAAVLQGIDGMIAYCYRELVTHHAVRPVNSMKTKITDNSGVTSTWIKPRMNRGFSQMTYTDLVDLSIGTVYYMVDNGYFATTVTAVRPDARGRRLLLGSMEFSMEPRAVNIAGSGNSSLVEIS
ncbi:MAG: hypothetical protein Q9218_007629 [Villophora microphyllina]